MGKWRSEKLGNYLELRSERNDSQQANLVLTVSNTKGVIPQSENFNHGRILASENTALYRVVRKGDYAYNPARINVGSIARLKDYEIGIISPMYVCFATNVLLSGDYLEHFIRTKYFSDAVKRRLSGSVRECLNFSGLCDIDFTCPVDTSEQRRIAAVLSAADEAIAASGALVEKYAAVKQGLMRDLFGKDERVTLDSGIAHINPFSMEKRPNAFYYIDLEAVVEGEIVKDTIVNRGEAPSRAQRLLRPKDILFQTVRPYQQNHYLFREERELRTVASTGYAQIRTDNDPVYLYYALHQDEFAREVDTRSTGTNYPAINPTELKKCGINFEPDKNKQRHIAEILTAADARLTAERMRLRKLKDVKRGLMDDLLTNNVCTDKLKGAV